MKTKISIICFVMLLVSCHSSIDNGSGLVNNPIGEVEINTSDESFKVDFGYDDNIKSCMDQNVYPEAFAKLKTREDLINYYKTLIPGFQKGYSNESDFNEFAFVKVEYMLAQECYDDQCDSKTRNEVLQLVVNNQKEKYGPEILPSSTQRTGAFLMAVILVKERDHSIKFIDADTLQKALLCLNNDNWVHEDFSNLLVECSENFLRDSNILTK